MQTNRKIDKEAVLELLIDETLEWQKLQADLKAKLGQSASEDTCNVVVELLKTLTDKVRRIK